MSEARELPERTSENPPRPLLRNGVKPHVLTDADRAKALQVRRQKQAERRARAEELYAEKVYGALAKAARRQIEALDAESQLIVGPGVVQSAVDHKTRLAAADRITDRALGKPVQRTEQTIDAHVEVDVEAKLLALLARHEPA